MQNADYKRAGFESIVQFWIQCTQLVGERAGADVSDALLGDTSGNLLVGGIESHDMGSTSG